MCDYVYIVLDNGKSCYDAGGIYCGVFGTREAAEAYLDRYDKFDRQYFEILEESV